MLFIFNPIGNAPALDIPGAGILLIEAVIKPQMNLERLDIQIDRGVNIGIVLREVGADRINIVQILEIRDHALVIRTETLVDRNALEIVDRVIVKLDIFYRFDLAFADRQKHIQIMLVPVFP